MLYYYLVDTRYLCNYIYIFFNICCFNIFEFSLFIVCWHISFLYFDINTINLLHNWILLYLELSKLEVISDVGTTPLSVHSGLSILLILSNSLKLSICTLLTLDLSFSLHNIVSLPYIGKGTSNVSCKTSTIKLQIPSINQGPDGTFNPPLAHHLLTAFCPICTRFIQNTPQIFKWWH